jgi:hypothetical protein
MKIQMAHFHFKFPHITQSHYNVAATQKVAFDHKYSRGVTTKLTKWRTGLRKRLDDAIVTFASLSHSVKFYKESKKTNTEIFLRNQKTIYLRMAIYTGSRC